VRSVCMCVNEKGKKIALPVYIYICIALYLRWNGAGRGGIVDYIRCCMCNRVLLAGRLTSQVAGSAWHNGYIIFRDMTRIWGRKHKNEVREKAEKKKISI